MEEKELYKYKECETCKHFDIWDLFSICPFCDNANAYQEKTDDRRWNKACISQN